MKRSLIGLVMVGLLFASVANAEVRRGDVILDFMAAWTAQNVSNGGDDIDIVFAALRPGIALSDNLRVGLVGAALWVDAGAAGEGNVWTLGVSGEYVFMPSNQLNPYIGAQIAYASSDTDEFGFDNTRGWMWGPRAGILYTLNTTNNFFVEYQYQRWEGDLRHTLEDGHMILLGIEHKFKVGQ